MKVNRSSLAVQVADYLRDQIFVRKRYRPGDFIREQDVSSEFGVSRGPVRDAIKLLVSEGLLEASPWRGNQVIDFTGQEIRDIAELRDLLERRAVAAIITQGSVAAEALRELEETLKEMEALTAKESFQEQQTLWVELDQRFRAILAAQSGLKWTERMLALLAGQMRFLELTREVSSGMMKAAVLRHRVLLEALKKGELPKLSSGLPERDLWELLNRGLPLSRERGKERESCGRL